MTPEHERALDELRDILARDVYWHDDVRAVRCREALDALRAENKRMHIHALNDASEIATLRDELTRARQEPEAAVVMMREVKP